MNAGTFMPRLAKLIAPAARAARLTFPAYRTDWLIMVCLSGFGALLEAAGFAAIYLLLNLLTGNDSGRFAWLPESPLLDSPLFLIGVCVVLFAAGMRLRYALLRRIATISLLSGQRAGEIALVALHGLFTGDAKFEATERQRRGTLVLSMKEIPFAAGRAARSFAQASVLLVQAAVIFSILFFISPVLTLVLLIVSALLITLVAVPFGAVVSIGRDRSAENAEFRASTDWFLEHLSDPQISQDEYRSRARGVMHGGSAERQFRLRLDQRRERQTSTLFMGYLYPLGAVALAVAYFNFAEYAPPLSQLVVYFLMFRQGVAALQGVGKSLMGVSRQHVALTAFSDILAGRAPAGEQLFEMDDDDDDED